eukprot:766074-Hanusia_phi.AAC.2
MRSHVRCEDEELERPRQRSTFHALGNAHHGGQHVSCEVLLDVALLRQIVKHWPSDSVVPSLRVCRLFLKELVKAPRVLLQPVSSLGLEVKAPSMMFLQQFTGEVELRSIWSQKEGLAMLDWVQTAVSAGWKGPTALRMNSNTLCESGAARLANLLPRCVLVKQLDVGDNFFGPAGAALLSKSLPSCPNLTQLMMRQDEIGPQGMQYVAEVLPLCASLEHLDLNSNCMGDPGVALLAKSLDRCFALRHLDLSNNSIENLGAAWLSSALSRNSSLSVLMLRGNGLGREGATSLSQALVQCKSLRHVDLGFNDVGDEGLHAVCSAAVMGSSLRELNLESNNLTQAGAAALAKTAACVQRLESVNVRGNSIGNAGVSVLVQSLMARKEKFVCDVRENGITEDCSNILQGILMHKPQLRLSLDHFLPSGDGTEGVTRACLGEQQADVPLLSGSARCSQDAHAESDRLLWTSSGFMAGTGGLNARSQHGAQLSSACPPAHLHLAGVGSTLQFCQSNSDLLLSFQGSSSACDVTAPAPLPAQAACQLPPPAGGGMSGLLLPKGNAFVQVVAAQARASLAQAMPQSNGGFQAAGNETSSWQHR